MPPRFKPLRRAVPDVARRVAFDPRAPQDERTDALGELQKAHTPSSLADALIPQEGVRQVVDWIRNDLEQQSIMAKAVANIPFPSKNAKEGDRGMQSVRLDNLQVTTMGDYWERPSAFSFDAMRDMVDQTPILSAVVLTRTRQIQRFCHVNESGEGPGFTIRHVDKDHQPTPSEQESMRLLSKFVANCGWEFRPRERKKLGREAFPQFMAKLARDSLTMDSAPIETEMRRDPRLGIDGFYAVDGSTIRLCTEHGYEGDDSIYALQVVQGRIATAYTHDQLVYEPRNPTSSVLSCGYGLAEPELLVRVVTGFLNAMTLNIRGFDQNSIPRGVLHLAGEYDDKDLAAFKRFWNSQVKGVNNAWSMPIMVAKDAESKASFEAFGEPYNEMYFSKWMTFLTSIICAIYGMSPAEINFDSFTGGNSSPLSGSDTGEKLAASKDSGLRPLLSYSQGLISEYIISSFSDKYVFRWTGLDDEDSEKREERARLILTVDEMRAQEGYDKFPDPTLGGAPINPSLMGPWSQAQQAAQQPEEDFGDSGDGAAEKGPPQPGDKPGGQAEDPQAQGAVDNAGGQAGDDDPLADGGADGMTKSWLQKGAAFFGLGLPHA